MNPFLILLAVVVVVDLFKKDRVKAAQNLQSTMEDDSIKDESNIDANKGENLMKGEENNDSTNSDGDNGRLGLRQDSEEIPVKPHSPENLEDVE